MSEISDVVTEQIEKSKAANEDSKLNSWIAIVVAVSASFMAIFNIKDNNIVQAMSQAQAHAIDTWSFYQAKSTKQHLAENIKNQLEIDLLFQPHIDQQAQAKVKKLIEDSQTKIEKYEKEKNDLKIQAESFQFEYDKLNLHDDQFDLAEAAISLALSILGITALVQKRPLFYFALALVGVGLTFGLAGFLDWNLHPDWLTRILG